jgi:hypothetical protein
MRQKMVAGHYDHASLPKVQMDHLLTQWGVEELTPETYLPYKPKRK